jgi:integrase/recombinase XerD
MLESISAIPSRQNRHDAAPLLRERDQFLEHLVRQGAGHNELRSTMGYLVHIVRVMNLTTLRDVELDEINQAGAVWAAYEGPYRKRLSTRGAPESFIRIAKSWLHFHGKLASPPPHIFHELITEFVEAMRSTRGLAPATIESYRDRAFGFLKWFSQRYDTLSPVAMSDIDDFIASKREAGWNSRTIAAQCQALRTFFRYAEVRNWCEPGLPLGIQSPTIPKYDTRPKGPTWVEVRKLLRSTNGAKPSDIRAKAIILLLAIYGLRSSEVAGLRLSDFDWRGETFSVRRAKRGGIQHYPIQYEVGEAILQYLQKARPHTLCRHIFVTTKRPHGPLSGGPMWQVVGLRMRELGVSSEHIGPHALRHACATHLLKKGTSLQDIADFLGHRDAKSIGIYAKYDNRSLKKVAAFSLAGIL